MELGFFSEGFWACVGALIGAIIGGAISYIISNQTRKTELQKQKTEYLLFVHKELSEAYTKLSGIDNFALILMQYETCAAIKSQYQCYFSLVDNQYIMQLVDAFGAALYEKNEKLMKERYLALNQSIERALRTKRAIITQELNSLYEIKEPKPLKID